MSYAKIFTLVMLCGLLVLLAACAQQTAVSDKVVHQDNVVADLEQEVGSIAGNNGTSTPKLADAGALFEEW